MRSDRESYVIVLWVVLALLLLASVLYSAIGSDDWALHVVILIAGELVLAGLGRLALYAVRPR